MYLSVFFFTKYHCNLDIIDQILHFCTQKARLLVIQVLDYLSESEIRSEKL